MTAYEEWMVRSNVERIASGEATAQATIALLQANGYPRVAEAVAAAVQQ